MRIAICDDERQVLTKYKEVLTAIFTKNKIVAKVDLFNSADSLMFALEDSDYPVDIVFLDINMPDTNGIDLARQIREKKIQCEIIFLTISQEHMLNAFDVGAFHYIVKDVTSSEKLEEICVQVAKKVNRDKTEVITVSCAGENRIIPIKDILYFEVRNYIIIVHYEDTLFEFYSTMGKIENSLLGHGFVRTHRSFLVNLSHIRSMMRQELELSDGSVIPIGRKYLTDLRTQMQRDGNVDGQSKHT